MVGGRYWMRTMSVKPGRLLYLTDSIGRVAQWICVAHMSPAHLSTVIMNFPLFTSPIPFPGPSLQSTRTSTPSERPFPSAPCALLPPTWVSVCPRDGSGDVGGWRTGMQELCWIHLGLLAWCLACGSSVVAEGTARSNHIPGQGWWPHISDRALSLIVPLVRTPPWGTDCLVASTEGWGGGGVGQVLNFPGDMVLVP